jgi:hypothetical protein
MKFSRRRGVIRVMDGASPPRETSLFGEFLRLIGDALEPFGVTEVLLEILLEFLAALL